VHLAIVAEPPTFGCALHTAAKGTFRAACPKIRWFPLSTGSSTEAMFVEHMRYTNGSSFAMLRWAAIFLVIAIIAAAFGFGGVASGAATIAKVIFLLFLVLFMICLLLGYLVFKKR
jgi:uncharacterized membrane protein YtjA (UPF0391 family)